MAREGTPAETRLNLEPLEEQAEEVPLWSLSPHLQPPRRAPTEGRGGAEDAVELGQGEPSAEGAGGEARRLRENRDPKAVNSCLKVNRLCVGRRPFTHMEHAAPKQFGPRPENVQKFFLQCQLDLKLISIREAKQSH